MHNHFNVYNSVALTLFTILCNLHYVFPKLFIPPKRNPSPIKQSLPIPLSQPLATTNPFSVSMDLPILDMSMESYSLWGFVSGFFH